MSLQLEQRSLRTGCCPEPEWTGLDSETAGAGTPLMEKGKEAADEARAVTSWKPKLGDLLAGLAAG